jgi:hypothetical protein
MRWAASNLHSHRSTQVDSAAWFEPAAMLQFAPQQVPSVFENAKHANASAIHP